MGRDRTHRTDPPLRRGAIVAAAVATGLLGACGSGGTTSTTLSATGTGAVTGATSSTSSAASSSSSAPSTPLAIVYQEPYQAAGGAVVGMPTVVAVGAGGGTVASATFSVLPAVEFGNAAPVPPSPVAVGGGAVFTVDAQGHVVRVDPRTNTVTQVGSVPVPSPNGIITIAVSPDGRTVEALVADYSAAPTPSADQGPPAGSTPTRLTAYELSSGGTTSRLGSPPLATDSGGFPTSQTLVGWDAGGPIELTNPTLATQNGAPRSWDSPAFHVTAAGGQGSRLGTSACIAESAAAGRVLCAPQTFGSATLTLETDGGGAVATLRPPAGMQFAGDSGAAAFLSPDGRHVATGLVATDQGFGLATLAVATDAGVVTKGAAGFVPEGWLDSQTIVGGILPAPSASGSGTGRNLPLGIVHLSAPTTVTPLNVVGIYVGAA